MKIKGQSFENDEVTLDGNSFEECKFVNCRMIYNALLPVSLVNCIFDGVSWHFEQHAALALNFMEALSGSVGEDGLRMIVDTFPVLRDWLKPEYFEKFKIKPGK